MNGQADLFDAKRSEELKRRGMECAALSAANQLKLARSYARNHARAYGSVTADDVGRRLKEVGIDSLGPAAGSIFKGREWEWTGEFIKSSRITNHSRLLRVWRLKE